MINIELTEGEVQVLQEVLKTDLDELHMEIHETDRRSYKEALKEKERMMTRILASVGGNVAAAQVSH